ncbi:MAG: preprotein translocase subunit SecE [Clostridia bacterium]|nr:preprotein translocase subunit SecE [Clostridia bacterium]MBR4054016.1 preprotein translocase subunit SecE [Clostridia bacterium]
MGLKIANFFKNYKSELKKVVWMPKNDLIKSTGIVLLVLVAACVLIGLLDFAFSALLNLVSSIG